MSTTHLAARLYIKIAMIPLTLAMPMAAIYAAWNSSGCCSGPGPDAPFYRGLFFAIDGPFLVIARFLPDEFVRSLAVFYFAPLAVFGIYTIVLWITESRRERPWLFWAAIGVIAAIHAATVVVAMNSTR